MVLCIGEIVIKDDPQSLLIPIGEIGTFTCKADCFQCSNYWIINSDIYHTSEDGHTDLVTKGFTISSNNSRLLNESVMTLTVNASEAVNHSSIRCLFEPIGVPGPDVLSNTAILLVIASEYC